MTQAYSADPPRKTEVILLNGPSSAGKSSIARQIEGELKLREVPSAVISLDDYLSMSPDEPIWEDDVFEVMPRMCADISAGLGEGKILIVDHVITSPRIYEALLGAAAGHGMKTVMVTCPLEVLRSREAVRADRFPGSAEASLEYLYPREGYDLCLDSGGTPPEELAGEILQFLQIE